MRVGIRLLEVKQVGAARLQQPVDVGQGDAGPGLALREAIGRHAAGLRQELGEAAASPLEKLLIRRLVVTWLGCNEAEFDRAVGLQRPSAWPSRRPLPRSTMRK